VELKAWFDNPNLLKLGDEEYEHMTDDYSLTYDDDRGRKVLLSELVNLCFFRTCKTEEEMLKSNHAKELLCRIGIWRPENAEKIVQKLMEVI